MWLFRVVVLRAFVNNDKEMNKEFTITHAYTAIVLVAVFAEVRLNSLKPNKRLNNEPLNEHKTTKARPNEKIAKAQKTSLL